MNTSSLFKTDRRALLNGALLGLAVAAAPHWAHAQAAYPSQPIRLVVPFTAGSGTDVIARAVGEHLEKAFK